MLRCRACWPPAAAAAAAAADQAGAAGAGAQGRARRAGGGGARVLARARRRDRCRAAACGRRPRAPGARARGACPRGRERRKPCAHRPIVHATASSWAVPQRGAGRLRRECAAALRRLPHLPRACLHARARPLASRLAAGGGGGGQQHGADARAEVPPLGGEGRARAPGDRSPRRTPRCAPHAAADQLACRRCAPHLRLRACPRGRWAG
eukprot:scaffold523_cov446-Prasinococcus_capsulatus_cf.AAC.20